MKMHFFIKILVVSFIFLFFCLLGEAYLRWHYFGLPTDDKHLPHPYMQVILKPGIEITDGERLQTGGFRKTGTFHEGDRVSRILAIGDSCTFSVASSNESNTYPSMLERELAKKHSMTYEVGNAGVPGYNSMQMFLRTAKDIGSFQPDEIIIYGGWNDFRVLMHDRGMLYIENNCLGMPKMYRHMKYWELWNRPDSNRTFLSKSFLYNHVYFKIKASLIKKKIQKFSKQNALNHLPNKPILFKAVFTHFRKNIENIITMARGRGINVSIITLATPLRREYTEAQEREIRENFEDDFLRLTPAEMASYVFQFNHILRDLSETYSCTLYDWESWYHESGDLSMFVDILHPSDQGYRYLVQRIVAAR